MIELINTKKDQKTKLNSIRRYY